jgi:hypothetical protein
LRADLEDRPARWDLIASIPFGSEPEALGYSPVGRHAAVPTAPESFAIGADRSIWVLDEVKRRIVHFTRKGKFLGAHAGLRWDRFHAHPYDISLVRGRPVVLELKNMSNAAVIGLPDGPGRFTRTPIHQEANALRLVGLVSSRRSVIGWVTGQAIDITKDVVASPSGYAKLDVPGSGEAHMLSGFPLPDGTFARFDDEDHGKFEAHFVSAEKHSVLPVRIEVFGGGKRLSAFFGTQTTNPLTHGFATYIQLAPASTQAGERYGDGRWILALFDDGSPLIWERLPEPDFPDEFVVRHIAPGPGDSIYLMQVERTGVFIYRR